MLGFKNVIFTTFCIYFTEATRSDGANFKDHTKNVREALQKAMNRAYKDAARTKISKQKGAKQF